MKSNSEGLINKPFTQEQSIKVCSQYGEIQMVLVYIWIVFQNKTSLKNDIYRNTHAKDNVMVNVKNNKKSDKETLMEGNKADTIREGIVRIFAYFIPSSLLKWWQKILLII